MIIEEYEEKYPEAMRFDHFAYIKEAKLAQVSENEIAQVAN